MEDDGVKKLIAMTQCTLEKGYTVYDAVMNAYKMGRASAFDEMQTYPGDVFGLLSLISELSQEKQWWKMGHDEKLLLTGAYNALRLVNQGLSEPSDLLSCLKQQAERVERKHANGQDNCVCDICMFATGSPPRVVAIPREDRWRGMIPTTEECELATAHTV